MLIMNRAKEFTRTAKNPFAAASLETPLVDTRFRLARTFKF